MLDHVARPGARWGSQKPLCSAQGPHGSAAQEQGVTCHSSEADPAGTGPWGLWALGAPATSSAGLSAANSSDWLCLRAQCGPRPGSQASSEAHLEAAEQTARLLWAQHCPHPPTPDVPPLSPPPLPTAPPCPWEKDRRTMYAWILSALAALT